MKTLLKKFPCPFIAVTCVVLPALTVHIAAQSIDTSTGKVGDSSTSPSVARPDNPALTKLVARMVPSKSDFKVRGTVSFSVAGDLLNVSGRIDGMEPNLRYELAVSSPISKEKPEAEQSAGEKQQGGKATTRHFNPATGIPAAGTANAGAPVAGPSESGRPNGETRPGAAGSGTQGTSVSETRASSPEDPGISAEESANVPGAVGILMADAKGGANINLTAHGKALTNEPDGIQGGVVTLTSIPVPGSGAKPLRVAEGNVEKPESNSSEK